MTRPPLVPAVPPSNLVPTSSAIYPRMLRRAGAAVLTAGLLASGFAPSGRTVETVAAHAADDRGAAVNPLPRYLEGLQVGPGAEFRFAVVHPILVPAPVTDKTDADPTPDAGRPTLAAQTAADALGVPPTARENRVSVRLSNLGPRPVWTLPGDVLRLGDGDHAVTTDSVIPASGSFDVPTVRVAGGPAPTDPREEPRRIGSLPGPALLWLALSAPRDLHASGLCADLAREAELDSARKSPMDLGGGKAIAKRVAEYRAALGTMVRPPAAGRREIAGYAVVLDGGFAGVEVWSDPARFAATWPERIEGIAVEAALLEVENGAGDAALPNPGDPDRYLRSVKDAMLALYGLSPKPVKVEGLGSVVELQKDDDLGRAVIDPSGAPQHLLWLRDPSRRRAAPTKEGEDPLDPGVISRKARPTEFEKRWLERRKNAAGQTR